jgi:hypothetical protein
MHKRRKQIEINQNIIIRTENPPRGSLLKNIFESPKEIGEVSKGGFEVFVIGMRLPIENVVRNCKIWRNRSYNRKEINKRVSEIDSTRESEITPEKIKFESTTRTN